MKTLIMLLSSFLSFSTFAAFDMAKDGLCFLNADKELRRFGPMGELGSKKGVCQGMSGLVSAFHEHAKFSPHKTKMTYSEAMVAVAELRRYHSGGCGLNKKVEIKGFANLNDFCRSHKDLLMGNAIDYNADIAVREISWKLDEFLYLQDDAINSKLNRIKMHNNVESLRKRLSNGRWPLMLYYSHVVTVHNATVFTKAGVRSRVVFGLYDSNSSRSITYEVRYGADGLPAQGQRMIWDITPSRLTTVCW